jgi:hypothetical protein
MELSIRKVNVLIVIAIVAGGAYYLHLAHGGKPPESLEDLVPGDPAPAPPTRQPRRAEPEPAEPAATPAPEPARSASDEGHAQGGSAPEAEAPADGKPAKRVRTADEQARSKAALAIGYAENRRFDLALETLDAAERLGPSPPVREEVDAARAKVLELLKARSR